MVITKVGSPVPVVGTPEVVAGLATLAGGAGIWGGTSDGQITEAGMRERD